MISYILKAVFWCFLALVQFLLGFLLLAPVLVIIGKDYYPRWLSWFQPTDTPAVGDQAYLDKEMVYTKTWPTWASRYWRAVCWGARNPAYGWLAAAGFTATKFHNSVAVGNENVDIGGSSYILGKVFRTVTNGDGKTYFDWLLAGQYGSSSYGYMIRFGWALNATSLVEGSRCNLCVGIRPKILLVGSGA
jgi:hypothetical protein